MKLCCLLAFIILTSTSMAQSWSKYFADTSLSGVDTATVAGKKYVGFSKDDTYIVLNAKGDTLLKRREQYYYQTEFKDFNKDGHKDIILHRSGNTPEVLDLFLYVPAPGKFKEVKDFSEFPDPIRIPGTKYYYSYHKSGCADLNWDSDLFYIDNFKAIRIGNISGDGCDDLKKPGVYIYKVRGSKKLLFKTLPIQTLGNYKEYKWGFINDYWTKNYKLFIPPKS